MIQSMTGFGKATKVLCNKKLTIEIKSLNSKQLDLAMRMPQEFRAVDLRLRAAIAKRLLRGKVDFTLTCEPINADTSFRINNQAVANYKTQIEQLANELKLPEPTDWYTTLLRLPEVLQTDVAEEMNDEHADLLDELCQEAIDALINFRKQEGNRLETFFEEKIQAITELFAQVDQHEQPRVERIKSRILEQLGKLEGINYDTNRLEQELIFYIEKLDITEEKIRLQNHLRYFLETLHSPEPGQGKKLGFICQEIGREINTMGSKANQAELQKLVVMMKDQLEQIKEQILNVL